MVNNEGETPAPSSGATAQAATSSNRPIVMPEAFSAAGNEEWDSWLSHFEDCAVINEWNDARKAQFLAVRMRGAALLQLQSLSPDVRGDYTDLKRALREKFVPKERIELHKAEFRARRRERDEKLPDLASSLRRLVGKAYPEAIPDLQDSLAKDQFIDALEDREIRMKIRESGPKTLDEAVSRALQIEAMYEAESRRTKGRSVRVIHEPAQDERSVNKTVGDWGRIQEIAYNAVVLGATNGAITLSIVLNHHGISRETPSDRRRRPSVGRGNRRDPKYIGE